MTISLSSKIEVDDEGTMEAVVGYAGRNVAQGFEYQFLCTLEHALSHLLDPSFDFAAVSVEEPSDEVGADKEIVDFGIHDPDRCALAVQVKSGVAGSEMRATQAVQILLRLLTRSAERYAVITNRSAGYRMQELIELLRGYAAQTTSREATRQLLVTLVAGSEETRRKVLAQDDIWWERLSRAEVVLDVRGIDEVYEAVRERVRAARHLMEPSAVGWDAAGLLTGYLIADVLAAASSKDAPAVTRGDLIKVLRRDQDTLKTLLAGRDWAVHVTPAPRGTDIGRHELLNEVSRTLPTPVRGDNAPVCVLSGLSGIGKTSLAVAWADDRADAYGTIMWIDASSSAQIEASFAMVASWYEAQGLIANTSADVRVAVFAALARTAQPWLMVFDNCSDNRQIRDWIPRRGHGHVIVTTTDQSSLGGPGVVEINVATMSTTEATRLLTCRLAPDTPVDDEHRQALGRLARRLHYWPLALELAAAYLDNCLGGLAGMAEYEKLVMRSLDDVPSVPLGYPRTLVAAILLAWKRMNQRSSDADQLAGLALRCAAFVASRQIPLHLLLACCIVEAHELASLDLKPGLWHYTADNPPPGEIVRALKRDSLVDADEPVLSTHEINPRSPSSPGYTISMNAIIQAIIRQDVEREQKAPPIVSATAFHTQYWMAFFSEREDMDRAGAMVGHAVTVAEHALRLGVENKSVALLLGNTAGVLSYHDRWADAVHYLRAELDYLERSQSTDSVMHMQTASALAAALFQAADRPREVVNDIVGILEKVLGEISTSREISANITAQQLRVALSTVHNLNNSGVDDPRLKPIQSALAAYCEMLQPDEPIDGHRELTRLNELIRTGGPAEAKEAAERLLSKFGPTSIEFPQILRILAEAYVHLEDWAAAQRVANQFVRAARRNSLSRFDSASFVRNVALACLGGVLKQNKAAIELFRAAVTVADLSAQYGAVPQAGDRDIIAVHRAMRACLDHDVVECQRWLRESNVDDIAAVEQVPISRTIHRILGRWVTVVETPPDGEPLDQTYPNIKQTIDRRKSKDVRQDLATIPQVSEDAVTHMIGGAPVKVAPLIAVALMQMLLAGGAPVREPQEVAHELSQALRILGFEAELVQTVLMVRRGDDVDLSRPDPTWFTPSDAANMYTVNSPHYVVWSKTFGRRVDPTIAHLPAFYDIVAEGAMEAGPVIVPWGSLSRREATGEIAAVPRPPFLLSYQMPDRLSAYGAPTLLSEERQHEGDVNSLFLALNASIALSGAYARKTDQLWSIYPQLAEILIALP